jgi:hypothetical protein
MTERFGKGQKDRPIKSAYDRNESRIFGSNSAYSGTNRGALRSVQNDRKIWERENKTEKRAKYLGQTLHSPEQ